MNKCILLGIDADLSPATQYALQTTSELIEQATPHVSFLLLTVIPMAQIIAPGPGIYFGQLHPLAVTSWQRHQAEKAVHQARLLLQQQGIASERMQGLIRTGIPAEEIAKVAREFRADLIVIGSRGNSPWQQLRRFLLGSTSRRVLQLAPCPVMIITLPPPQTTDLVIWYENAITRYLHEHTETLFVFTPREVSQQFAPPDKKTPGRKELVAATRALEQLASNGTLCRHTVKGEPRYVND